ncbi:MAG: hypothetical protein H0T42_34200 [Deltaproteobacteria bacterium]|nr:hypothetical protein [Deltaproteobacteria bacterium]
MFGPEATARINRATAAVKQRLGLEFGSSSPLLNIVFATETFVGEYARRRPQTFLVGPSMPGSARVDEPARSDFPWHELPRERPIVFVSYGTQLASDGRILRIIAEAAAPLGVKLVVAAKNITADQLPGDVLVVPYVPQLELLARAAACVTHGGGNTVNEALYYGVPMIVDPIAWEQPVQAYFVEKSGVGISMRGRDQTVEEWRRALTDLLAPSSSFRERARVVGDSYKHHDGASEAARLLVKLANGDTLA